MSFHTSYSNDFNDFDDDEISIIQYQNQSVDVYWSRDTEYIFVNQCLCLDEYGYPTQSLPSYACYQDNTELYLFWDNLEMDDYNRIYKYLKNTDFIMDDNENFADDEIMNKVISFRQTYFFH